jgi:hypothetical protein
MNHPCDDGAIRPSQFFDTSGIPLSFSNHSKREQGPAQHTGIEAFHSLVIAMIDNFDGPDDRRQEPWSLNFPGQW